MLGTQLLLPFLTAFLGAIMGRMINPEHGLVWGGGVGFGIGLAVVVGVSLLIAMLRRL